jgi:hypothetical protein
MMTTTAPAQSRSQFDQLDRKDRFDAKAAQLHALLAAISGEGFTAFNNLADANKQNLLWLASDLAEEVVHSEVK